MRKSKPVGAGSEEPDNVLKVDQRPGEPAYQAVARKVLEPGFRHGMVAADFGNKTLGSGIVAPGGMDYVRHIIAEGDKAVAGDMEIASRLLVSQAITLDTVSTELMRRAGANLIDYPDAADKFMRLALKAQGNSRATIEALTKLHQPREQVVRHVHVNEGGQAVIAENFHHHRGAEQIEDEQPHAKRPRVPTLSCPDPLGQAVPITSGTGSEALPNAQRQGRRRA